MAAASGYQWRCVPLWHLRFCPPERTSMLPGDTCVIAQCSEVRYWYLKLSCSISCTITQLHLPGSKGRRELELAWRTRGLRRARNNQPGGSGRSRLLYAIPLGGTSRR